jgi:nucleotide-binding universal stress UspA family protein
MDIDLVIVGARGRTAGISIFLGSVTDSLIKESKVPVLAIKQKGTGLKILERIFSN